MSSTRCRPVHRETRRETRGRRGGRRRGRRGGSQGGGVYGGQKWSKLDEGMEYRGKEGQRVRGTEERGLWDFQNLVPTLITYYASCTPPLHLPYTSITKLLQSVRSWYGWQRMCRASATNMAPLRAVGGRDNGRRPPSLHGCLHGCLYGVWLYEWLYACMVVWLHG